MRLSPPLESKTIGQAPCTATFRKLGWAFHEKKEKLTPVCKINTSNWAIRKHPVCTKLQQGYIPRDVRTVKNYSSKGPGELLPYEKHPAIVHHHHHCVAPMCFLFGGWGPFMQRGDRLAEKVRDDTVFETQYRQAHDEEGLNKKKTSRFRRPRYTQYICIRNSLYDKLLLCTAGVRAQNKTSSRDPKLTLFLISGPQLTVRGSLPFLATERLLMSHHCQVVGGNWF